MSFPCYTYNIHICLLYTSDAADEGLGVDLGGRRIIKKKAYLCVCCMCNMETTWRLGSGNVTDHRLWRISNIVLLCFSLFYRLTWVSVSVLSSFMHQDISKHPETRLLEIREAFERSLLPGCQAHIFAHISHFFRLRNTPCVTCCCAARNRRRTTN